MERYGTLHGKRQTKNGGIKQVSITCYIQLRSIWAKQNQRVEPWEDQAKVRGGVDPGRKRSMIDGTGLRLKSDSLTQTEVKAQVSQEILSKYF